MEMEEEEKLLTKYGYTLNCSSPHEISNNFGDTATGEFADLFLELVEKLDRRRKKKEK